MSPSDTHPPRLSPGKLKTLEAKPRVFSKAKKLVQCERWRFEQSACSEHGVGRDWLAVLQRSALGIILMRTGAPNPLSGCGNLDN